MEVLRKATKACSLLLFDDGNQDEGRGGGRRFRHGESRRVINPLWRAWTLMAVGYALTKQPGDAVQLYESAAQTLEKCPPTLRRVEVAFKLAELWGERDPTRAFEVLSRAVVYANQIKQSDVSPLFEKYHLHGSYAVIGELDLQPATEPADASDLRLGEGVGKLSQLDWSQTEYLSRKIQETPLRLRFQLKMCEAGLSPQAPRAARQTSS
jgi:hypothetical protein